MSPTQSSKLVLISCGEPSGDVYAAQIARALRLALPGVRLAGVGGEQLAATGAPLWASLDELSVMGFLEVVRHLPRLARLRDGLAERAAREGVALLIAVDYPGFHVQLAARMRARGIPTLDVIPPKTWSWGAWRLRALRRSVARCAVIFPFEQEYYRSRGVDARFVGHPLLDQHAAELGRPQPARDGLLLCPGSRRQELARIGPAVGKAAAALLARGQVQRVRVSRAPAVDPAWLRPLCEHCPAAEVVEGPLLPLLRSAQAAVVTSGTATIEAALARTPHVIVYRTSAPTYWLARALITVPHIGMANIVLGRRAVPELVQGTLHQSLLQEELAPLLAGGSAARTAQESAFDELRALLGDGGAADRIAAMAVEMLEPATPAPTIAG